MPILSFEDEPADDPQPSCLRRDEARSNQGQDVCLAPPRDSAVW
jgi:hypothetical protein